MALEIFPACPFFGSTVLSFVARLLGGDTRLCLLCALSWNLTSIVVFRMLQGMGGGALIPTASAIMLDRFPKAERGMAMAIFGMGAMMGPLFGPSLGGWLDLRARKLSPPPEGLADAMRGITRTEDFAMIATGRAS